MPSKPWYTSLTIQAGATAILGAIAMLIQAWGAWQAAGAKVDGSLVAFFWPALTGAGGLFAVIGRWRATTTIAPIAGSGS